MRTRRTIAISVAALAVLVFLIFMFTTKRENKYQWYQSYRADSEQPYGLLFIQKMLKASYKGDFTVNTKQPIHKLLAEKTFEGKTDYVLIGQSIHLDEQDVEALKQFMSGGNDVFIATMEPPATLIKEIYYSDCEEEFTYDYTTDTAAHANFYDSVLRRPDDYVFRFRMGALDYPYFWRALDAQIALCDTTSIWPLGYHNAGNVDFLQIPYDSGSLYLHTVPLMFTNYFISKQDNMEYASTVFSQLSGDNIIWDEVSKIPFSDLQNPYDSPLYYIMQQPALKYAWWMLLIGGLLYVIFASKRTQRVIPVLEPKSNTSLEFLNVISSLHYQNPNHLDMARKKMKYFLYFIRAKYGINTQSLTEEQSKRLAERSKVDIADIQSISDKYKVIENYSISNDEPERLVGLYQAIEKFYKNCK